MKPHQQMRVNFEQLREAMISGGYITAQQIAQDISRLGNPLFMAPSPIMWAAWGQRASR